MTEPTTIAGSAKVVYLSSDRYSTYEVVINRGRQQGVKLGDRYLVFALGPEITDPDSGENLGRLELVRGRGEVVHLQDNLSTVRSIERLNPRPGKRITKNAGFLGQTIEEDLPAETSPFRDAEVGDLARAV